jgi:uncharacterized protein (DUF305 family)
LKQVVSGSWQQDPRWTRVLVVAGLVLTILFFGASAGLVSMSLRGSGPVTGGMVDVGFSQDMSVHHRQAALMAGLARTNAIDPELRVIAYDIETTQLEQIGRMQGWLNIWGQPALPAQGPMRWMSDPTSGHTVRHADVPPAGLRVMPGMASEEELQRLRRASSGDFEVLFLQLMLRHHQGGTPMLAYAAQRAETPQVRNLARQMLIAQTGEITVFADLLTDRAARPLPPPVSLAGTGPVR